MSVTGKERCSGIISFLFGIPLIFVGLGALIKVARSKYETEPVEQTKGKGENSIQRFLMPPHDTAAQLGVQPGMIVMEIGPGNGTYALAAAQRLGNTGRLVAVDPQYEVTENLRKKIRQEGIQNMEVRQANINQLPYDGSSFDMVYMISMIGKTANPVRLMQECRRVLSKDGKLVFREIILDPNYPSARSLIKLAKKAGFRLKKHSGNFLSYTLIFEKDPQVIQ